MALYKLAWSYFNMYDYPTAIRSFEQLIERIDTKKSAGGLGPLLRKDAIDYLGVSLADDDWDGDGEKDKDATVSRALSYLSAGKPYEREVMEKYADTLYSQHEMVKYPMAIEAYRAVVAKDPLNPANAAVKEKIIGVYDVMRDTEKMTAERANMVKEFGPGSAWYQANASHPEVLARVDRQVELALSQAAQFHNKRAQELKAQATTTGNNDFNVAALQEYRKAAAAYEDYLKRFPDTKYAYENAFFLAECYYYSFEFQKATQVYLRVRDWPGKNVHQEAAAFNVVVSIEKEAAKRIQEGTLVAGDAPGDAQAVEDVNPPQAEGKVQVDPLPIPPLTQDWMKAVDWYLEKDYKTKDPEQGVRLKFRVAAELFKRRHLEEARRRFEEILVKYPESAMAAGSAVGIINSYRLENDWDNLALWSKKIEELKVGKVEERAALAQEVKVFQLGAQFKDAEKAFEAGEYQKAAEAFLAVVDADPRQRVADKGLQNAAVAYQKLKHYDSAARIYQRIVADYPESQYVEGALYQLAENARKFLDFDRAVRTFQALQARFPKSEHVAYAMFQTAVLLEAQGKLREAAQAYEKITDAYPSDAEAGPVLFKAGGLYEKLGTRDEALRVYKRFAKQFGGSASLNDKTIEVLARSADIYRAQGQMKDCDSLVRIILKEFAARGLQPSTPAATHAARFQFALIEEQFKQYDAIQFTGSLKEQGKLLQQKKKMLGDLEVAYAQVLPYKSPEWTSAAVFRMAQLYELFAKALFKAQVPKMTEEEEDIYRTQLEDAAKGYQDAAQERYVKIIEENRRLKNANDWTRKAVEAMNKYRPAEFPLEKEERRAQDLEVRSVPPFEESL
jgi:TolA-binding protein